MATSRSLPNRARAIPETAPNGWYLLDASLEQLGGPFPTLMEARAAEDRLEASGRRTVAALTHHRTDTRS